jgi:hypothetical protein
MNVGESNKLGPCDEAIDHVAQGQSNCNGILPGRTKLDMFLVVMSGVEVNFELSKQPARLKFSTDSVVHLDKYTAIDFFVILPILSFAYHLPILGDMAKPLQRRLNIFHKNKCEK